MAKCVAVLDIDAFFAQVEELREPELQCKPLAVFQKFLVITCNYAARAAGVTKLMRKEEAIAKCPSLVLRNGEDTTPYRKASKHVVDTILAWADKFDGVVVERLGMDEFCLDISRAVWEQAGHNDSEKPLNCEGHIFAGSSGAGNISSAEALAGRAQCFRPMDLRVTDKSEADLRQDMCIIEAEVGKREARTLAVGSQLTCELRKVILETTGLRTSAGISQNRLLSKLAAGLHKPDAQTVLFSSRAPDLMNPLSIFVLPGVGCRIGQQLSNAGITTLLDVKTLALKKLQQLLVENGEAEASAKTTALRLQDLACGNDDRPIQPVRPPGRISVEDSFRRVNSFEGVRAVLQSLAPELLSRLREDGREARQLVVSWRIFGSRTFNNQSGTGNKVTSRSVAFPPFAGTNKEFATRAVVACAEQVLRKELKGDEFHLTKINLAATSFADAQANVAQRKQQSIMTALSAKRQPLEATIGLPLTKKGTDQGHTKRDKVDLGIMPYVSKTTMQPLSFVGSVSKEHQMQDAGKSDRMSQQELRELECPHFDLLSDEDELGGMETLGSSKISTGSSVIVDVASSDDEARS